MLRVTSAFDLTSDPGPAIYQLASSVYSRDVLLPRELVKSWSTKNPQIFWLVHQDDTLVAYIKLFPLEPAAFARTLTSNFDEKSILPSEISAYRKNDSNFLFLSSIVVAPELQGSGNISRLLRIKLLEDLIRLTKQGVFIKKISSEALNVKGEAMLRSLGLRFYCDNERSSKIYMCDVTVELLEESLRNLKKKC